MRKPGREPCGMFAPALRIQMKQEHLQEQEEFMRECERRDAIYIIFYASDFNTLKERLFKRGDTQQVLDNAEKINEVFKDLAEQLNINPFII